MRDGETLLRETPPEALADLDAKAAAGRALRAQLDPQIAGAAGFTHFDLPSSEDNRVTILLSRKDIQSVASQTLVRIKSAEDQKSYLGVVVRGPFAEPDAVPANSTMAISVVANGKQIAYIFDYHGRADVEILGEEVGGKLVPPRYRPRPKSPVYVLDEEESAKVLGVGGDMTIGRVVGYQKMEARIPSDEKNVLPRHTAVIGTTGGGKSTTIATIIHQAQAAGIATIVFDVEGEYTEIDQPTDHEAMKEALKERGAKPEGVGDLHVHHLVGRETTNPNHPNLQEFTLNFSRISPYALGEILNMSDAQMERFLRAYDVAKLLLKDLGIFPRPKDQAEEAQAMEVDEMTTGYPRMTIDHVLDVVSAFIFNMSKASSEKRSRKEEDEEGESVPEPYLNLVSDFKGAKDRLLQRVRQQEAPKHEVSWRALAAHLWRFRRFNIFDVKGKNGVDYESMLTPGRVSIVDLSDTDSPQLNNVAIAEILRGLQELQEDRYRAAQKAGKSPAPVLIIIEEAHEFLSSERVSQMPILFQQVARIAKRGRKRWLGLVFVTQLPQHLPNEVLGLVNNFVIHKITDSSVVGRLQRTVGSIDEGLWGRVPRLAPGQALVSFTSFQRPLLVAVDPAPCKRRLVD